VQTLHGAPAGSGGRDNPHRPRIGKRVRVEGDKLNAALFKLATLSTKASSVAFEGCRLKNSKMP
jgi:hypothetical protein